MWIYIYIRDGKGDDARSVISIKVQTEEEYARHFASAKTGSRGAFKWMGIARLVALLFAQ